MVADLGPLRIVGRHAKPSTELPSARQAAEYLANFCSAYNLGSQSSAALAAVLCFRAQRRNGTLAVPKPRLVTRTLASGGGSVPSEFDHLRHYMALGLSPNVLPTVLESILWEPSVPCNFCGTLDSAAAQVSWPCYYL